MPATSTTPAPLEGRCLSRQDCRYRHITAAALIGQIKLTRIHVALLFLPGVRVKRIKRRSLYNVERSGFFVTEATQKSKLCSLFHTLMYLGIKPDRRLTAIQSPIQPNGWWWSLTGSNRRHPACKAGALPAELRPQSFLTEPEMVGPGRLELPTSRLSGVRSNHLSYGPDVVWTELL